MAADAVQHAVEVALSRARLAEDGGGFVAVLDEAARAAALRIASLADPGPLAGVTVAVKDVLAVQGQPLEAGSAARADVTPEPADAAVVRHLRDLGAVVIGRTATHELAFGVTGVNEHSGTPENPSAPTRIPGGSSSGSAVAVATGAAEVALGSDTGGSVRIPAALCGVVGFKPAWGEYPTAGLLPLAPSLDHVGLLARSVDAIRRVHAALGHDPGRRPAQPSFGVVRGWDEADEDVRTIIRWALDRLADAGARLVDVPWISAEAALRLSTTVMYGEAARHLGPVLQARPAQVGADVRRRIEYGQRLAVQQVADARDEVAVLRRRLGRTMSGLDAILGPTVPLTAPLRTAAQQRGLDARLVSQTCLHNLTGTPAVSVPVPGGRLPVGLQVSARSSAAVLGAALLVEAAVSGPPGTSVRR